MRGLKRRKRRKRRKKEAIRERQKGSRGVPIWNLRVPNCPGFRRMRIFIGFWMKVTPAMRDAGDEID